MLSGDNGQGKTNLLEAIYALCTLRSFRTAKLTDVMRIDCERSLVRADVRTGELMRQYELELRPGRRTSRIDGKGIRSVRNYFGNFNVVLFAPEDLAIVRGSPSGRRRFLDRAVFTWRPSHLGATQEYEKVLRSRNRILREATRPDPALLDVYDEQLARTGAEIITARTRFLDELAPLVTDAYARITRSGLDLRLAYDGSPEVHTALASAERSTAVEAALCAQFAANRGRDIARGASSDGPHRDDLDIRLAGQPAKLFASQGQTRAIVLAWKTALLALLTERRQEAPILLLDDVSSELDAERNAYLFSFIAELEAQCFITTTHRKFVLLDAHCTDFAVRAGHIEKVSC